MQPVTPGSRKTHEQFFGSPLRCNTTMADTKGRVGVGIIGSGVMGLEHMQNIKLLEVTTKLPATAIRAGWDPGNPGSAASCSHFKQNSSRMRGWCGPVRPCPAHRGAAGLCVLSAVDLSGGSQPQPPHTAVVCAAATHAITATLLVGDAPTTP